MCSINKDMPFLFSTKQEKCKQEYIKLKKFITENRYLSVVLVSNREMYAFYMKRIYKVKEIYNRE